MSKDRLGGIGLLIFCVTYGLLGQDIQLLPAHHDAAFHARTMPDFLALLGIGLAALLVAFPPTHEQPQLNGLNWKRFASFLALMSLYGLSMRPLGFVLSTAGFLIGGFVLLGERSSLKIIAVAAGVTLIFWITLSLGLGVFIDPMPAAISVLD